MTISMNDSSTDDVYVLTDEDDLNTEEESVETTINSDDQGAL